MTRATATGLILALAAAALAGCSGVLSGFTPMYGQSEVRSAMALIETPTPTGRIGEFLREEMDDALGRDKGQPPVYRLRLKLSELRLPRGLRTDNVADRYELHLRVDYMLIDLKQRKLADQGFTNVTVTYDSPDQPYAGVAGHLDAEERAAGVAADNIRLDLAAYFANPDKPPLYPIPVVADADSGNDSLFGDMGAQAILPPAQRATIQPGADTRAPRP